jgi:DNA modification methylase
VLSDNVLRHNGYHSQFEMVLYAWKGSGGGLDFWNGDRKQSDVWNVSRDGDRLHPTQKPVEVCSIPLRNSSKAGDIVLEPFAGSGSTIIACEQLGRRCRAIEIEPRWVDCCVKRWEEYTGRTAERVAPGQ